LPFARSPTSHTRSPLAAADDAHSDCSTTGIEDPSPAPPSPLPHLRQPTTPDTAARMGGGDLNMKKSWHTGTFANQERVWKKEREALEERKKLQQLQKELEQERAVQELQRLQEAAGGKKRDERVDWMYAAPAEGNGPNPDELEAYLLGKKRVDKLLKGNEEKLLAQPTEEVPGGSFQSLQNANTSRDTASKIREDPMLAIKRQEQLQYEKMMKDPRKRRELREAREAILGGSGKSAGEGESKEERRARKEARRAEKEARSSSDRRHREDDDRHRSSRRSHRDDRSRSRSPRRSSHRDDDRSHSDRRRERDYRDADDRRAPRYSDERDRHSRPRSPPPPPRDDRSRDYRRRSPSPPPRHHHSNGHSRPDYDPRSAAPPSSRPPPPPSSSVTSAADEAARKAALAARLEAMQSSAASLSASRAERLSKLEAEDRALHEREERERKERGRAGDGVGPGFIAKAQGVVYGGGMDLGERMRRSGRVGLVGDRDD
ncbi:Pre-mRNA splicing factor-domain containing protein, partial [Rhodotorula toruloides]